MRVATQSLLLVGYNQRGTSKMFTKPTSLTMLKINANTVYPIFFVPWDNVWIKEKIGRKIGHFSRQSHLEEQVLLFVWNILLVPLISCYLSDNTIVQQHNMYLFIHK